MGGPPAGWRIIVRFKYPGSRGGNAIAAISYVWASINRGNHQFVLLFIWGHHASDFEQPAYFEAV